MAHRGQVDVDVTSEPIGVRPRVSKIVAVLADLDTLDGQGAALVSTSCPAVAAAEDGPGWLTARTPLHDRWQPH